VLVLHPDDHGGAGITGRAAGEQADPAAAQDLASGEDRDDRDVSRMLAA
jgi:hypothetical protein